MSTVAPPPVVSPAADADPARSSSDELIDDRILEACKALWWAELVRAALRLAIAGLGVLLVWVIVDQWVYSPGKVVRIFTFGILLLSIGWYLWQRVIPLLGSSVRPEYAARSLERDLPELRQSLTSYVTLRGDRQTAGLRNRVVRSIGSATAGRLRSHDELPAEATGTLRWWVATAIALALLVAYGAASPKNSLQSAARLAAPLASIEPARRVSIRDVLPGDSEAIAGRPLSISAEIRGIRDGEEAICSWDLQSGRQQISLEKKSVGGRYRGQILLPHSAAGEVFYRISAGDATAGPFRLHVQDVPVVAVDSVAYQPPRYTGQSPHTSSSGAITGLDLTRVTIRASTNRAVAGAVIEFNPRTHGELVQATAGAKEMAIAADGKSLSIAFTLRSARGRSAAVELESYRIKVWDSADQSNPEPIIYPIRIVADLPPDVAIMLPVTSPSLVPVDAQQVIEVHASDPDFGLKQIGLEIRSGIDMIGTPILWSQPNGAKGNQVAEYRFRPAAHGLRIGDRVEVIAVATDNRSIASNPSVTANVTLTDPIELKITASQPLPNQPDPDAEGLSAPDDRPASDHPPENQDQENQDNSDQGGDGQDGQGQDGQGQDGQSGESGSQQSGGGQSGQGQSQSGQGQQQSGSGQSGESGQQSGEGQGQSGEGQGQSGAGQQQSGDGQGQSGTEQGQSGAGQQQSGEGQQQSGEGQSGGTSASDQAGSEQGPQPGDPTGDGPSSDGEGSATPDNAAGQPSRGDQAGSSGQQSTAGGQPDGSGANDRQGADGSSGQQSSDGGQPGSGDNRSPGAGDSARQQGATGEPNGAGDPQESAESGPPKHDGDAFERIRDYLEQMKQQQGSGGDQSAGESAGSAGNQQQQGSGAGGEQNESNRSPGSNAGDKTADRSNQNSGGPSGAEQDRGPSGAEQGAESDGAESDGAESDGADSDGADSDGAGNQQSGQQSSASEPDSASGEGGQDAGQRSQGGQGSQQSGTGNESQRQQSVGGDQGKQGNAAGSDESPTGSQSDSPTDGSQTDRGGADSQSQQGQGGEGADSEQGETQRSQADSDSGSSTSDDGSPARRQSADSNNTGNPSSPSGRPAEGDGSANAQSTAGGGDGGDGSGISGDESSPIPPDPVNVEYAKQATDMVLDYLEQTRDAPDQDLLEKLDWSEDDLKRFADRWKKVRELPPTNQPGGDDNELTEALQSLGLRPPGETSSNLREQASSLRRVRDAGNRKPPPAAYRDAFDAFRRAVGRQ